MIPFPTALARVVSSRGGDPVAGVSCGAGHNPASRFLPVGGPDPLSLEVVSGGAISEPAAGSCASDPAAVVFYPGLHQPGDAKHFERAFISVNRVRGRKKPVDCDDTVVDSAAFTELSIHGEYRHPVGVYAEELHRLHSCGVMRITAAVAQDYMCEPFMLRKTGLTIARHQGLTVERYVALIACNVGVYILPVLQGYAPEDYVRHLELYGSLIPLGAWVGVGSVCKRNSKDPASVLRVFEAIHGARPDLRLHAFGVKITSLAYPAVRRHVFSADSLAWSFAARWEGRDANDWREAKAYLARLESQLDFIPRQAELPF